MILIDCYFCIKQLKMRPIYEKDGFVEVSKNLTQYRSENYYVGYSMFKLVVKMC